MIEILLYSSFTLKWNFSFQRRKNKEIKERKKNVGKKSLMKDQNIDVVLEGSNQCKDVCPTWLVEGTL